MPRKQGSLIQRIIIERFGGLYTELIGRRAHLGAGAVIFDRDGRVLLARQSYGHRGWELPGGGRQPRESLEQAVRRELREEIGVELTSVKLCGVYYEPDVDQHHFAFRSQLADGATPKPSSPEILECGFWPMDALPRPMSDFTLRRIQDARSSSGGLMVTTLGPPKWLT